jgi:hypothetical protein
MLWDYGNTCLVRAHGSGIGKGGSMSEVSLKSPEELAQELEKLKAENASLKKARNAGVSFKVSEKGAVSVYGLGRFPVTLYKEQWERLLSAGDQIRSFMADNSDRLKVKE